MKNLFRRIVNLGTGGSDLGPRLVADALADGGARRALRRQRRSARPASARSTARSRTSTLIVVVSKTFTTQETMANAERARQWGCASPSSRSPRTPKPRRRSARARSCRCGTGSAGAISVWSAVGFAAACAIGFDAIRGIPRRRARDVDEHFAREPAGEERAGADGADRASGTRTSSARRRTRCCPTRNALRLLPAYLQQLEMESNGKRVDREGRAVEYATAPVLWGAEGTVSQHSLPPAAAPGHAGRAGGFHRLRRREEPVGQLPRAGRRACVRHRRPRACRRIGSIPATGPRACSLSSG